MITIKFPNKKYIEKGLRIIIMSGLVEYTATRGVYRVPDYVVDILNKKKIRFICIKKEE